MVQRNSLPMFMGTWRDVGSRCFLRKQARMRSCYRELKGRRGGKKNSSKLQCKFFSPSCCPCFFSSHHDLRFCVRTQKHGSKIHSSSCARTHAYTILSFPFPLTLFLFLFSLYQCGSSTVQVRILICSSSLFSARGSYRCGYLIAEHKTLLSSLFHSLLQ